MKIYLLLKDVFNGDFTYPVVIKACKSLKSATEAQAVFGPTCYIVTTFLE